MCTYMCTRMYVLIIESQNYFRKVELSFPNQKKLPLLPKFRTSLWIYFVEEKKVCAFGETTGRKKQLK